MNYRELLSGRRRDPLAALIRGALAVGEVPYRAAVAIRNRGFDHGRREVLRCGVPVISIGNLTTGGTGKTPLVRYVARTLRQQNLRVALVSRGYGSTDGRGNDEALELAWSLPDVPHLQNPDRVAVANIAVEELESQVILMDDGFQHRRLHRDLDIVVIDATCPFGYDHLLPRGLLREPITALQRADAVVLSRSDAVTAEQREAIRNRVLAIKSQLVWATAVHQPTTLLSWPEHVEPVETLGGRSVAVLSAIGNPEAFVATVKHCGADVVDVMSLPDHDPFAAETVVKLRQWIMGLGNRISEVVCTHKDLVKLQTDRLGGKPLRAVLVEIAFVEGQTALDGIILSAAQADGSDYAGETEPDSG